MKSLFKFGIISAIVATHITPIIFAQVSLPPSQYTGMEKLSWSQVRRLPESETLATRSVNIPLCLPMKKDMAFMSPSFVITTAPLLPRDDKRTDLSAKHKYSDLKIRKINFLIGDPLLIPAPSRTFHTFIKDGVPAFRESFLLRDIQYTLEACVVPDSEDGTIYLKFTATNECVSKAKATFAVHVGNPFERDVTNNNFDYNTYSVDNERLPMDASVDYKGGSFLLNGKKIAEISNNGWEMSYIKSLNMTVDDYNCEKLAPRLTDFHQQFYRTLPHFRLKNANNILKFSSELEAGQTKSIELAMSINGELKTKMTFAKALENARTYWAKMKIASADFGNPTTNAIWRDLQQYAYISLRDMRLNNGFLQPFQGHSNRYEVWTCETADMMRGFTELGLFENVKPVINLIFSWQDKGNLPEGKFTNTNGAIGATGPAWVSSTGAALMLACEYIKYSGDTAYYKEIEPKLVAAAGWILGEVANTRKNQDLPYSGLMPPGRATDEDYGCSLAVDVVSCAGVMSLLELDEFKSNPKFEEFSNQSALYRADISRIAKRSFDGSIPVFVPGCGGKVFKKFKTLNMSTLLTDEVFNYNDPIVKSHVEAIEKEMSGLRTAVMDRDVTYVNWIEYFLHSYYLKTGQYKKAWSICNFSMKFGMSRDLHLTLERASQAEPLYSPFQPNGSANGRILCMLKRNMYFEYKNENEQQVRLLLGGIAPFDFEDFGKFSITDIPTKNGEISLSIENAVLKASWSKPAKSDWVLVIGKQFKFVPDNKEFKKQSENSWLVPATITEISGKISVAEK